MPAVELSCRDIGRCGYVTALGLQQQLVEQVQANSSKAFLVLVEHDPPVITLGKGADVANVLASNDVLAAAGIEVHKTTRGGDVTYHGPGQLVGYPILDLNAHGRDVKGYIRMLEDVLIRTLERFDIQAETREGLTGVWTDAGKIAAIGIAVSRWVTCHGFALNVCPDLSHYEHIVPCGLSDRRVTSMSALLGRNIAVGDVKPQVIECMQEVFRLRIHD
ncbi:hypothetical protein LCGC14_2661780 [marine sediment metagenome]|uniref:lipoyl(octanoyl) transferase n=1 Tax=marine sediment metagenome TaxID=412755 RepID=A0A0F9CIN5_9ZZZZ